MRADRQTDRHRQSLITILHTSTGNEVTTTVSVSLYIIIIVIIIIVNTLTKNWWIFWSKAKFYCPYDFDDGN